MSDNNNNQKTSDFFEAVKPIITKFIENIDTPFVWMPLGLFCLCILAYPITQIKAFPYSSLVFLLLALGADWVGRWQNRQTSPVPTPEMPGYRKDF